MGLIIIYLVSQLVRQLIQPKIVGDTIGLNPLVTLFCMFIGYKVGGILAMIIAVPIGMILILSLIHIFGTLPELYNALLQDLAETEDNLQGIASRFPPNLTESLSGLIDSLTNSLGDVVSTIGTPTVAAAGSIARNIPNVLVNVIFAVLSAYFFIAEREKILQWVREHTPASLREKWIFITGNFKKAVGGYFKRCV